MSTAERVYLVHGFLESAAGHYSEQIKALRDDYEFVPVDLPGHGRCPVDADGAFYAPAEEYLAGVLAKFGRGHVMAASYVGVPVAVRVARRRPDLFSSLVLQGFVPDLDRATFAAWMDGFEHLAMLADHHPQLARGYERVHGPRWKKTVAAVLADVERSYDNVLVTGESIAELGIPVLLVNGSVRTVEREAAESAARLGPMVAGHVIPDAGHLPGRQRPREFNRVITDFWRSLHATV